MKAIANSSCYQYRSSEITTSELEEGTEVEIIILADSEERSTIDYLLSTESNRKQLLEAIERVEKRENLVVISPETWHEKYSI